MKFNITELEKQCELADDWESLGGIVSRYLEIPLSTPRDVQRILKKQSGAEAIRKLVICSQCHTSDKVFAGIMICMRNISEDSILARHIYEQNLHDLAIRYLAIPRNSRVHRIAILTFIDLLLRAPILENAYDLTIRGLPKLVRIISDPVVLTDVRQSRLLRAIISGLPDMLARLSTYKFIKEEELSTSVVQSFQLPSLAKTLIELLLDPTRFDLSRSWGHLQFIAISLVWIAYFETKAIHNLPDQKGVTFFVALTTGSSVSLRCSGFLGLLNRCSRDYCQDCQEIQFCSPQLIYTDHSIDGPEAQMRMFKEQEMEEKNEDDGADQVNVQAKNNDSAVKADRDTVDRSICVVSPSHLYDIAMRFVHFLLQGPQSNEESYQMPYIRLFESADIMKSGALLDMIPALKSHGKECEAEVVLLGVLLSRFEQQKSTNEDREELYLQYMTTRSMADEAVRRWPNNCYFYYAMIRGQTGEDYLEWAAKGLQCSDCTPYLKGQIHYQTSLNLFGIAVTYFSSATYDYQWWSRGANSLKRAGDIISQALRCLEPGCPQERMMVILRFTTNLLIGIDTNLSELYCNQAKEALETLRTKGFTEYLELRAAIGDLLEFRAKASDDWSSFLSQMEKLDHVVVESRRFKEFQIGEIWEKPKRKQSLSKLERTRCIYQARLPQCAACGNPSMGLKVCARCGKVKYCKKACQESHWKEIHKKECRSPEISV
ncbi:hypothetical protein SISNIDRAFT_452300 [Sistotremastrum niveocremeum HHB9708]|uniref:MYND-type domain-containing protein n=1 Tax=Sistotremastrum niveocremeum HHB9708 TaxID=1314777 RepID=A0A164X5C4_9AGAM|nr:hypothetical protein SISNIDRAFT_452300 [Sistotremastrum niveocremeum HHB9708]